MQNEQVIRKYGRALFLAAQSRGQLDAVRADAEGLIALLHRDQTLLDFLHAPQVTTEKKDALIGSVFSSRVHPLVLSFLRVLIEKHRIISLPGILDECVRLIREEAGIVTAKVVTAAPLTAGEREALIKKLSEKTKKTIALESRIDPAILGGVIVILGDTIIDGSVHHHLQQLREQLERVRVA